MSRSKNAQIAVDLFDAAMAPQGYTKDTAWIEIAKLLLTCNVYQNAREGWTPLYDGCVIFRESNDFRTNTSTGAPNETVRLGRRLGAYLATQMGVSADSVCATIAAYWRVPGIGHQQPHNLVGHAFRSLCVAYLERFGDPGIAYEEEVSPHEEFPGFALPGASTRAKVDIVARRGSRTVALFSSKWRYRHDRVEFIEEFNRYLSAARRSNPNCELYAVTGEFSASRLAKALDSSKPIAKHGPISATVHFAPQLVWDGLGVNGKTTELKSLEWLASESYSWK